MPPSNWAKDIASILYKHCVSCHRNDGVTPFTLTTYEDAVAYHHETEHAVIERHIPPWGADPAYRESVWHNYLTDSAVQTIVAWTAAGHPQPPPYMLLL